MASRLVIYVIVTLLICFKLNFVGYGRVEVAWGLYLFTFCVIASLALSFMEDKKEP